jgi:hypothetical protein
MKTSWGNRPGQFYIRFAHEMNGTWYPWAVRSGDVESFKSSWRRYRALQKEIFPEAKLVFSPNRETIDTGVDWRITFPGSQYVDVMGLSYYNHYPHITNEAEWSASIQERDIYGAPKGLAQHLAFARSQGLPLGISEWSGKAETGDSAYFMTAMHRFFSENAGNGAGQLAYEIVFNVDMDEQNWLLYPSTRMPRTAEEYRNRF